MRHDTSRHKGFARATVLWLLLLFAAATTASPTVLAATPDSPAPCSSSLQSGAPLRHWDLDLGSQRKATLSVTLPANRLVLLEAHEDGVDVDLEVTLTGTGTQQAGNPVRRWGILRILLHTDSSGLATVSARATADGGPGRHITLQAYDEDTVSHDACWSVIQALTAGDAAFAQARLISLGRAPPNAGSATDLYGNAYQDYLRAFVGLAPENLVVRAETAQALAAVSCEDIGEWHDSERWAALAATLFQRIGDARGRANALSLQAISWMELAQLPDAATAADPVRRDSRALVRRALDQLRGLAVFYQKQGNRFDEAEQLNLAGVTLYNTGLYNAALTHYLRAQKLFEGLGEHYQLALVLQNVALVEWDMGRASGALNAFQRALDLVDSAESPDLYELIVDNYGLASRTAGHFDAALSLHSQALDLATRTQHTGERGRSLFGIGMVYSATGERSLAANFLHQALPLLAQDGEGRDTVSALRALAMLAAQDGQHEEAIRLDRQALVSATGPIVRAHLLAQIADSESLVGRNQEASEDLSLAERIPEADDPVSRALLQLQRGILDYRMGRLTEARALLLTARATDLAYDLDAAAFDTDVALARVDTAAGNPRLALRDLDAGLKLSELLRVQVSDPELRASSMQPLRPAFELKVDLLAAAYHRSTQAGDTAGAERAAREALAVTERARGRVMQDIAVANYTRGAQPRVEPLLNQKSRLLGDIAAHAHRLEAGGARSMTDPRVAGILADVSRLREQLALVDSQLAVLTHSSNGPLHSRTVSLPPTGVAVISYWLGTSTAYAWVQTRSTLRLVDLGPADAVRAAAEAAHLAYSKPDGASMQERLHSGASLSRLVLQPVLSQLPVGIAQLVVIPDGPLHYVSFAALPLRAGLEDSFLVEKFEIAYGASIAAVLTPKDAPRPTEARMLLVSDAVYAADDPRLPYPRTQGPALAAATPQLRGSSATSTFERLPATAAEARGIAEIAEPLNVELLQGFSASRAAVLSRPLERYRYLHFAVHTTTDAEIPQLSSLVLSNYDTGGRPIESRIWAGDLMARRFNARVVVLSACETALGRDIGGEGLFGLRYVVLARGAQSVIASLWSVPDASTATLMQSFYRSLLQKHLTPQSALTLAARQLLREGPRDPVFWAPFTATITSLQ